MWTDAIAVLIGLCTGATMSVATSCIWCVLHLPARLQDQLNVLTPHGCAWAISTGLLLSSLRMAVGFTLPLPPILGALGFGFAGMFVGMLAAALGEIMEVTPVLAHRFRISDPSRAARVLLTVAKGLGALIACLAVLD